MSPNPQVQNLELRAMEQRNQLHQSVTELKQKVSDVREKLDIKKRVRHHIAATSLLAGGVLLLFSIVLARSFDP
ncbi:MAG TPA: hypothetical protein VMP68_00130 [Candidatus Eisenbacteria bacterium]|nr:hypothetical protein [Candidatus Eisenbacteria bacterium]